MRPPQIDVRGTDIEMEGREIDLKGEIEASVVTGIIVHKWKSNSVIRLASLAPLASLTALAFARITRFDKAFKQTKMQN